MGSVGQVSIDCNRCGIVARAKNSKVLRQREIALQEMRSAGGKLVGCFSRGVCKRLSEVNEFNCADVRSCAGKID